MVPTDTELFRWEKPTDIGDNLRPHLDKSYLQSALSEPEVIDACWEDYLDCIVLTKLDVTQFVLYCSIGVVRNTPVYNFLMEELELLEELGITIGDMAFVFARDFPLRFATRSTKIFSDYYHASAYVTGSERLAWSIVMRHLGVPVEEVGVVLPRIVRYGFDRVAAVAMYRPVSVEFALALIENGVDLDIINSVE